MAMLTVTVTLNALHAEGVGEHLYGFWPPSRLDLQLAACLLSFLMGLVRNTSWYPIFNGSHFENNIFIDPIVSARKKAEKRDRHGEREREREREREKSDFTFVVQILVACMQGCSRTPEYVKNEITKKAQTEADRPSPLPPPPPPHTRTQFFSNVSP